MAKKREVSMEWVQGFRLLGQPVRLRMMMALAEKPKNVEDLCKTLGLGRPLLCNHLAQLRLVGLVTATRRGRFVLYKVNAATLAELRAVLEGLMTAK